MRPVPVCPRVPFSSVQLSNPPQGEACAIIPLGRSEPSLLFILAQTSTGLRPHVAMVRTTLGHELTRVLVLAVPSGLGTREGTREAVASGLEIEDGVDGVRRATISDSEHDRVLVRTHDLGDVVEHRLSFQGLVSEGPLYHDPS